MDCSKMNEYIINLLDERKLTLTSLAKQLKMNVDELADALSSSINIDLYDQIADILKVSIDTIILCKKKTTKKFTAKFETAVKNGPQAIASLKNQGTNLLEPDSYGVHIIEYAMDENAIDSFNYILENNYFALANDQYLKKHLLLSSKDKELYFRCLLFILKHQLSKQYYLISKFGMLNHGLFKGFEDEYRYLFLYYINKNQLDLVLDEILAKKYYKIKFLKVQDDILSYSSLSIYAIEYHLDYIATYLGKKMLDFQFFVDYALKKDYEKAILLYFKASDPHFLSQAKNYATNIQNLFLRYCIEENLELLSVLLQKQYYTNINEGFEKALMQKKVEIYRFIYQNAYQQLNKDQALISACKVENEEVVQIFLKDATIEGKKKGLQFVNSDPLIMAQLIEAGAYFENKENTLKQMSVLLQYLIQKGGK